MLLNLTGISITAPQQSSWSRRMLLASILSAVAVFSAAANDNPASSQPVGDNGQIVLALHVTSVNPGIGNSASLDPNAALTEYASLTSTSNVCKTTTPSGCPAYLIVNVVDWSGATANGSNAPQSRWFLVHPANNRSTALLKPLSDGSLRIFGSKNVGFLAVHLGISSIPSMDVRYTIESNAKKSVQETDALSLFDLIVGKGGGTLARALAASQYMVGARAITNILKLPSDVVITGGAYPVAGAAPDQKPAATFSQTYDNEGFAHWDVSVGIPVKSVSEVQYNSTDGSVQDKTVSKVNAYGLFHWYPYPVDLKADYPWMPSIVAGLSLSGKPLNKPFAGLAMGFRKPLPFRVNVFAGIVFNKVFAPTTLTTGSPATPGELNNDLASHRVKKLLVGIDIPIPQFIKAISNSKSN